MPFRRRSRRTGFARPAFRIPRTKRYFSTVLFNESSIAVDATSTLELTLLQGADWQNNNQLNQHTTVRRVMFKGVLLASSAVTAAAQEPWSLFWALYINDEDDTDVFDPPANAAAIVDEHRVLRLGCVGMTSVEVPAAGFGTQFIPSIPISFDIRTRFKVRAEDQVTLALSMGGDASAALSNLNISGVSRVLTDAV